MSESGNQHNTASRRPERRGEGFYCDLLVIGAGSAGLSVAAGAVQMGASVVLAEKGAMGGDCLNTGCIPSKSLIAAAHAAQGARRADRFGVQAVPVSVEYSRTQRYVQQVIAAIAPHDSVDRFEGLGVTVIRGTARFVEKDTVEVAGLRVQARRIVIATGSKALVPPIAGLSDTPFLTNETIFELRDLPERMIVIGGGPIGVELAQAFQRLGSSVTVVERLMLLANDEPEARDLLRRRLKVEGVEILEQCEVTEARKQGGGVAVSLRTHSGEVIVREGSHLLVAAGRSPNLHGLALDAAGIEHDRRGVKVDSRLRTSNRRVFAAGDVASGPQFTHAAGYHASIIIRNALFGLPAKVNYASLPWVTYTDPEIAHAGLTEEAARKAGHAVRVLNTPLDTNDRARAENDYDGFAKVVIGARGTILGATIAAPRAGELIGLWVLAIGSGLKIGTVAGMIAPYPTLGEISKRAAGSYFTPSLFSPRVRTMVGWIQRWLP